MDVHDIWSRSDGSAGSDGSPPWKPDCASGVDFEAHCTCSSGTLAFSSCCSRASEQCIAGVTHQHTQPTHKKQLWTPRIPTRGPHKMMSLPPARSGRIIAGWLSHHSETRSILRCRAARYTVMLRTCRICSSLPSPSMLSKHMQMSGTRSSFTSSATATKLFRLRWLISRAMLPRAEAQQQHRGSDMARSWPSLGKLARPGSGLDLAGRQATGLSNLSSRLLQLQNLPLPGNILLQLQNLPLPSNRLPQSILRSQTHTKTSWLS